jgi:hypothetical protein
VYIGAGGVHSNCMKAWVRKILEGDDKLYGPGPHPNKVFAKELQAIEDLKIHRAWLAENRRKAAEKAKEKRASAVKRTPAPDGRGVRRVIHPDGTMMCRSCKKLISLTEFYIHRSKSTGVKRECYDSNCNQCRKNHMAGRRVGLSIQGRQNLIDAAGGVCQICGVKFRRPNIDHCHLTGKIRGVLCSKCNSGLAVFRDSPIFLRKAADYLEKSAA